MNPVKKSIKPKAGESEDDFVKRCMSLEEMKTSFPNEDQRLAVCYSKYGNKTKAAALHGVNKSIKQLQAMIEKEQVNNKIEKSKVSGILESIYKNLQEISKAKQAKGV